MHRPIRQHMLLGGAGSMLGFFLGGKGGDQSCLMLMHVGECSAAPGMTHCYGRIGVICISQVEAVKLCNAKHG